MLGGALLGLGLGSLMSSGNRNVEAANQNPAAQSSGANGDGTTAAGAEATQPNATMPAEQPQENRLGSVLLLGAIALAVYFLIRRVRARASRHRP